MTFMSNWKCKATDLHSMKIVKNYKFFFQTGRKIYIDILIIKELEVRYWKNYRPNSGYFTKTNLWKPEAVCYPKYEQEFFPTPDDIPRIFEEDGEDLRKPVTQDEMLNILKGLKMIRSKAKIDFLQNDIIFSDKISKRICSADIWHPLIEVFLIYLCARGNKPQTKNKANTTNYILNSRNTSLLNVDYKIQTIMPPTRINGVLHTIINPDQKGFVPDKCIGENIIEITCIIDKLEIEDNPGLLVSTDCYKTFDTLEWSFIKIKAFECITFPKYWIKWKAVICNNIDSQIIHNGYMSWEFIAMRG